MEGAKTMARKPCCSKQGVNKGAWTSPEDKLLTEYIKANGDGKWRSLPAKAGLNRCGKSCRLRWLNYLRPDIKRGNITEEEEELIARLHKLLGNRWSLIAGRLPGRTDNEVKNYWNTHLRKKLSSSKPPDQDHYHPSPNTKNDCCAGVDVIRTKAVRCTRPLFSATDDQARNTAAANTAINDYENELAPTVMDPHSTCFPDLNTRGVCLEEIMQDSVFMQAGDSNMSSESLLDAEAVKCGDDDEGLYSFDLDIDVWDCFIVPQEN